MPEKYNIEELIVRFLQQEISEEELRYLESWLEEDAKHKSYFFELKSISDSCKRPSCPKEANEASWQKMLDRIRKSPSLSTPSASRTYNIWIAGMKYAAIAILAVGLGWGMHGFYTDVDPLDRQSEEMIAYNEIHVQKGGKANTVILSDGTKVILNAATTFRYPSRFNEAERQVYLDGEAYFEVTKNTEKPFVVKLKKQDVTVLGTSFNVEAYAGESYSIVTLLNGSVAIDAFNESGESAGRMYLKPNQRAVSDNKSGSVSLSSTDASLSNAWIDGVYRFKDEPLSAIVKRLENYYNVEIHLEDEQLERVRYTGTFSLNQDIGDVLRIINYEGLFMFKRVNKEIFITSK